MQDNLIINHTFNRRIEVINVDECKNGDVLFSFNENEPILISFSGEEYDVQIECISYRKNDQFYWCEDNLLKLKHGEQYVISEPTGIDIYYSSAKYQIIISKSKEIKICYFDVLYNKEMPEDGMYQIIERLNNFISGLSIDFFKKSPINNILTDDTNSSFYIYELLKKNEKKIVVLCDKIINNCRNKITSSIILEDVEKKQNIATIRKNILSNTTKFYNIKKSIDFATPENIILKKYILKIISILKVSAINLEERIEEKKSKISLLFQKQINLIDDDRKKSRFAKQVSNNHIISIQSEIDECNRWIEKMKSWEKSYTNSLNAINMLMNSEVFNEISVDNQISYSQLFFSNPDYNFFKRLFDLLNDNLNNIHIKNKLELFSDKRSYIIFEIYGFILIQNILKELGFLFQNNDFDVFTFSSNIIFEFFHDNYKIQIMYDHFCEKSNQLLDDVFNINSINCKPDYIIKIFHNEKIKHVVILEIKYRYLRNMVASNGGSTETDSTMDDYAQLAYKKENKIERIDNVILLFPSIAERNFKRNMAEYIGINAEKNLEESKGYQRLKKVIEESIQEIEIN